MWSVHLAVAAQACAVDMPAAVPGMCQLLWLCEVTTFYIFILLLLLWQLHVLPIAAASVACTIIAATCACAIHIHLLLPLSHLLMPLARLKCTGISYVLQEAGAKHDPLALTTEVSLSRWSHPSKLGRLLQRCLTPCSRPALNLLFLAHAVRQAWAHHGRADLCNRAVHTDFSAPLLKF